MGPLHGVPFTAKDSIDDRTGWRCWSSHPVHPVQRVAKRLTLLINGQTVGAMGIMSATSPLSVTGLPGVSMRFGTSHEGMPIGVQIVGSWQAESTILQVAALLEQVSPVRDLHPHL